jgi:hypothetical protein
MADNDSHIYPINDLREHITVGVDCPCKPEVEVVGASLLIIHNSFDHREIVEEAIRIINGEDE